MLSHLKNCVRVLGHSSPQLCPHLNCGYPAEKMKENIKMIIYSYNKNYYWKLFIFCVNICALKIYWCLDKMLHVVVKWARNILWNAAVAFKFHTLWQLSSIYNRRTTSDIFSLTLLSFYKADILPKLKWNMFIQNVFYCKRRISLHEQQ